MALVKENVEGVDVDPKSPGAVVRQDLVGPADGAPNFTMRRFSLQPGSATPHHSHDWEHEVLILGGSGTLRHEGGETPFGAGTAVYVPPNEKHQFVNSGDATLSFICVVTNEGHVAGLSQEEQEMRGRSGAGCEG